MFERSIYRIFDYCWHEPHQFELVNSLQGYCQFDYCLNWRKHWDTAKRPVPPGLQFVPHYEHGLYDFALFHIDQRICTDAQQLKIYTELNDHIDDIPKIVINHGSPVFPEAFEQHKIADFVRSITGGNTMVVNSYAAASGKEWGFGKPIIPGLDPADWYDHPKELRAFTAIPVEGLDAYYNRKCLKEAGELLFYHYGILLYAANYNAPSFNSFNDYRNYLGSSLIYIDTSTRTPMNTARTEAFLSGCCVVQVEGAHDLEKWAKDGENIILVPDDPPKISAVIAELLGNRYEEALQIGQNGKKMATELFNRERYRNDWLALFKNLKS
ncbi:hypothetical protein A4D02_09100 [Niastella koreensis]|uniref:Uncharacterized protein n=2 Tax=Niastella koreensis TaxID=354356 RepID=G8TKL6_NIAKG|nr:hypothetical protein [Niastella koreensis]AEV98690.1 hypothetical protein Niako_2346 [Niastella koreensis GR20-10]OQP44933.1 hypothetical protein A4D02_09100 [Niastella koreensis]